MKSISILAAILLLSTLTVTAQISTGTTIQQRGTGRIYDVVGADKNGAATQFSSMIRSKIVNLLIRLKKLAPTSYC